MVTTTGTAGRAPTFGARERRDPRAPRDRRLRGVARRGPRGGRRLFPDGDFLLVTVIDELEDPMADAGGFEGPAMDEAGGGRGAPRRHRRRPGRAGRHRDGLRRAAGAPTRARAPGRGPRRQALRRARPRRAPTSLVVGSHGHGVLADALLGRSATTSCTTARSRCWSCPPAEE